ncbi:DUF2642 domain-containing protein [Paenibacillus sp. YYML68]|uniref:DUF2642 domain-containing protein n=1 Tax=Paenibacillus sp. YYML68 TaxID=2909250 RepID=UPI00248F52F8|nr:DUF2642 domain-containing protein [Paenibacillus sp. YYML68]
MKSNEGAWTNISAPQNAVDQSAYVGRLPAAHSPIVPIPAVPQPGIYVTQLEPVFVQHISRHQGQRLAVMTTAGRVEGTLAGVGVDHIQMNVGERSLHIRIPHIVYFEGPAESYR